MTTTPWGLGLALPSSAQDREALPRVFVLATGGTIASRVDADSGALEVELSGEEIVDSVPGLTDDADVTVEQVANVPSRDITPEVW